MASIGIAGAGLMGRYLAFELAHLGHAVTLFDKDDERGEMSAGLAAAAMLAPVSEAEKAPENIILLGLASLPLWRRHLARFDVDIYFQQRGSLLVAHSQDTAEMHKFQRHVSQSIVSQYMESVDQTRIAELEPALAQRFHQGLYLSCEGQLANNQWYAEIAEQFAELGVDWRTLTPVQQVLSHEIITDQAQHRFDLAIDCRGLGARPQWPQLRGVRGELLWLHAPEVTLSRPVRLMHPRYNLYISPRPDGYYLVGASEIESEDMSNMSVRSNMELLSATYSVDPAFGEARITKSIVNCRPALPDNQPKVEHCDGLMRVNGLYRHGYLCGPAVAEQMLQLIDNRPLTFPDIVTAIDKVH